MKVTVILVVNCALGTVPLNLELRVEDLEFKGPIKSIQITAFLRSARILTKVLDFF